MSKSKRELLKQLLELEDEDIGDLGKSQEHKDNKPVEITETINDKRRDGQISSLDLDEEKVVEKPRNASNLVKKKLTEKQLEALKKGQDKRNENRIKNKLEKEKKEEEERKILEEKLVKKAIAVKKKQIKKQALLDEISDDDTPIQKVKQIAEKIVVSEKPKAPVIKFF